MTDRFSELETKLREILRRYRDSFSSKNYSDENDDPDLLMEVFGITPALKRENRQYWGRELGMCWQLLVTGVFSIHCKDFSPAMRMEDDEPCDCFVGRDSIDTKYRIGSGDSGTLKKFRAYAKLLASLGYRPVLLIVRQDNLSAALNACVAGGWIVHQGDETFGYIRQVSGFDLAGWLEECQKSNEFFVKRT